MNDLTLQTKQSRSGSLTLIINGMLIATKYIHTYACFNSKVSVWRIKMTKSCTTGGVSVSLFGIKIYVKKGSYS